MVLPLCIPHDDSLQASFHNIKVFAWQILSTSAKQRINHATIRNTIHKSSLVIGVVPNNMSLDLNGDYHIQLAESGIL